MAIKTIPTTTQGSDLAQVQSDLHAAGVPLDRIERIYSDPIDDGKFIEYDPPGGFDIDTAHRGVIVRICDKSVRRRPHHTPRPPAPRTFVPLELGEEGVTGYEAEDILRHYRLGVRQIKLVASNLPYNTVVATKPAIGAEVNEGDLIEVHVSDGGRNKGNSFWHSLLHGSN